MKNKNKNTKLFLVLFLLPLMAGFFGFSGEAHAKSQDVIINELMWMGSSVSTADEWLELKNLTEEDIDFSKTPWSLYKNDSLMIVIDEKVLASGEYFLVSNNAKDHKFSGGESVLNITPDFVSSDISLSNSAVQYKLYASSDNTGELIDTADDGSGSPLAGENEEIKKSMERNISFGDGTKQASWHACYKSENMDNGVTDCGTPKHDNSQKEKSEPKNYSDKIYINEFLPAPSSGKEEYIELYNPTNEVVDLSGWKLTDASKTGKYLFPNGTVTQSLSYFVVYKRDFKFSLNNSGAESITLFDPEEKIVSFVSYSGSKTDASYNFDGSDWHQSKFLTPGKENKLNSLPKVKSKKAKKIYVNTYAEFSAEGSDADRDHLKFTWDFGDDHKSYLQKTHHKYDKSGKYKVTLKVTDGSEDVFQSFNIEVKRFPKSKITIVSISPNPKGKDSDLEYITLKNETKKKIDLKDWIIATGSKNLYNHKIKGRLIIKPGQIIQVTRKISSFSLNNKQAEVELRYPDGKVASKVAYDKKTETVAEDEIYTKESGTWAWVAPKTETKLALAESPAPVEAKPRLDIDAPLEPGIILASDQNFSEDENFRKNSLENFAEPRGVVLGVYTYKSSRYADQAKWSYLKVIFSNLNSTINSFLNNFFLKIKG